MQPGLRQYIRLEEVLLKEEMSVDELKEVVACIQNWIISAARYDVTAGMAAKVGGRLRYTASIRAANDEVCSTILSSWFGSC